MAARLELHAGAVDSPAIGFVSASDDDEERLAALLADLAGRTALSGENHGTGHVDADGVATALQELSEIVDEAHDELERAWATALRDAVATIAADGGTLAWSMRYDTGGSLDDGTDEFPTDWSKPPF